MHMKTYTIPNNVGRGERDAILRRITTHMMRALRKLERMQQREQQEAQPRRAARQERET